MSGRIEAWGNDPQGAICDTHQPKGFPKVWPERGQFAIAMKIGLFEIVDLPIKNGDFLCVP